MSKADPQGYYGALKLTARANQDDIRLAYVVAKKAAMAGGRSPHPKVQAAYETLSDPEQRLWYDGGRTFRVNLPKRSDGKSLLDSVPLLIGAMVILAGVVFFTYGPTIQQHFIRFDVGDELHWKTTSKPLGSIEGYEERHSFPDGTVMAAYSIKTGSDPEPTWYTAKDLHRHAVPR